MLIGTLCVGPFGNTLAGKGTNRASECTVRAGQDF